jgi:hypothetical protein
VDVRTPRYDALDDLSHVPPRFSSAEMDAGYDDETPDFREVMDSPPAVRRGAKPQADARHVLMKGRELRIDKGTGGARTTGSPRGEPPKGWMSRLAGALFSSAGCALRRFFRGSS